MALYRVAVRLPDDDDVPRLLRGARTLYAATGEGTAGEVREELADRCAEAAAVFAANPDATWEAGARFGRRGRPSEQRIYRAADPDGVASMLAAIDAVERRPAVR